MFRKGYGVGEKYTLFSTVAGHCSGGPNDCACMWSTGCFSVPI